MKAGINTERSILAKQLSLWSDWAYTLCLTKKSDIKANIEKISIGDKVTFVREPGNEKDPNAIIVHASVGNIGYLAGGTAEILAPLLDKEIVEYSAEVAEVVPYSRLENKRMNPIVRLYIEINDIVNAENGENEGVTVNVGDTMTDSTKKRNMITVFVDKDVINSLVELGSDCNIVAKQNINIEFIDAAPLTAEIIYDGENADISIFVRNEMHTNSNKAFHGTVENRKVTVHEGDEDTVHLAFSVAEGINKYLQENDMVEECSKLDEDWQGVIFELDKGLNIIAKVVEGKKRPALLCTTLFGAPRMVRPYTTEIIDQFAMEALSFEEMEEAAENGDSTAMEHLAMGYLNGDGVDVDPEKAYYWFCKLAETGDDRAMFNVGLFTAKGFGIQRDFVKAAEWMQKAADEGDKDAETCAAEYHKLAEAVEKANAGDAQAQADLAGGLMKLGGSLEQAGEGKDYEESVMWAEKAVAQGNPDGYWILALAYQHGRGVNEDIDKALELYQKGAEAGSAACMHNLGCEYMSGENVHKDTQKAFELIKTAAEQGYGLAMRDLGKCYQFAKGTSGNMKKAVEWYEKALQIIDDPELAQKTAIFKSMADIDPSYGEDYPDDEEQSAIGTEIEDATELIRKGLKESGKAYDDDDIAKLSIEQAYEAFASAMNNSEEKNNTVISEEIKKNEFFKEKIFVLTGFDSFTEPPVRKIIEENGGIVKSSTVLATDYLIYYNHNSIGSKKYERAIELNKTKGKNIKIFSLRDFMKIAEDYGVVIPNCIDISDDFREEEPDMRMNIESDTGNEKASNEEAMKALKSGQGVIKQTVTLPDGTKKELAIWGGYELDGFDRTLNVFMNHTDIHTFIEIVRDNKIDTESLADPCENEEGIQVTVDFLDIAGTLVYRKGQGKLSTALYVRDERKTCQDTVEEATGEIELNENGSFSLDKETLQEHRFLLYAIMVTGLRRYLLKEGIVKKLYDMFDESAGVIVRISKAGTISTKIVKGMDRPDLPCEIFLLGEQMCRPYIDEMLGLKSSGIRKPRDPEFVRKMAEVDREAKEKAEAEKKKKAEEALKAEEEKKAKVRAEAEAAEMKRRKEMAELEERVERLKQERQKEEQQETEYIKKIISEQKVALLRERNETITKYDNEILELEKMLENEKKELAGLGLFKFSRKKELNSSIENIVSRIKNLKDRRAVLPIEFQDKMNEIDLHEASRLAALASELNKKYAIPDSPEEIERRKQEEIKQANMTPIQKENERIKGIILEFLAIYSPATIFEIFEIFEQDPRLGDTTHQRVSALLRQLTEEGKINKRIEGKRAVFELA